MIPFQIPFQSTPLGGKWNGIVKASETRLNKRIDELREDQKASEARQREDLQALRQDMNDGLGRLEAKVDRLIESRLPSSPRQ